MTQEQILRAFENRWRVKVESNHKYSDIIPDIKSLCLDFFTAGILIAEGATVPEVSTSGNCVMTVKETVSHTNEPCFDTWWKMYDKKIDRGKCEKKWAKLSDAERRACIAATPAYVASTPDIQYRRHPMTYLNNKSWENQIIPRSNDTKPTIEQQRIDRLASILTE